MKRTLLLSILFAVITALCVFFYLSAIKTKYKSMDESAIVVVANQSIPQGALIRKEMLSEISAPKKYIQPKSFNSLNKLFSKEGKSVYMALSPIEEGEQILPAKVSDTSKETGIAHIIPDRHKALPIYFKNENTDIIKPGNRIDILSVIEYSDSNKKQQETVFVIAQDVLVLAVDNNYFGSSMRQDKEDNNATKGSVTVSVTIEEAQIILLAGERGSLKFILRPIGDSEEVKAKLIKMSDFVSDMSQIMQDNTINQAAQNRQEILNIINKYSLQK